MVVADWDKEFSYWSLDTTRKVSSPSSIKIYNSTGDNFHAFLSRNESAQNVRDGMMIGYCLRPSGVTYCGVGFTFRNQASLGSANHNNCYLWYYSASTGRVYLNRYVNASYILLSSVTFSFATETWIKFKTSWWSDPGLGGLVIRLERWNGSNWVKVFDDYVDSADYWKDSSVNRCGPLGFYYGGWHDDTEIYLVTWA
jgi:hypothetical protein